MKAALAIIAAVLGLVGCAGAGQVSDARTRAPAVPTKPSSPPSPTAIPLGPTPAVVTNYIARAARRVDFVCALPRRYPTLPGSKTVGGRERTPGRPGAYMATFNTFAFKGTDGGHVLLGGQRAPFSLRGHAGQTWPRPGQPQPDRALSLPTRSRSVAIKGGGRIQQERPARILRRATIHGLPALVLNAPPYPLGLIHGGHVIVIWNEHHHGYLVSLHFTTASTPGGTATLADRVGAALSIVSSTTTHR